MKLSIREDGRLTYGSAYKLFAIGWLFGVGLFLFVFLCFSVGVVFLHPPGNEYGVPLTPEEVARNMGPAFLMIPLLIIVQAFIFSGLGVVGLMIYSRFSSIRVTGLKIEQAFEIGIVSRTGKDGPTGSAGHSSSGDNPQ